MKNSINETSGQNVRQRKQEKKDTNLEFKLDKRKIMKSIEEPKRQSSKKKKKVQELGKYHPKKKSV